MIVLHIASPPLTQSDSLSSPPRSRWRLDSEDDVNEVQDETSYEYKSPVRSHGRPRAALPRPAEIGGLGQPDLSRQPPPPPAPAPQRPLDAGQDTLQPIPQLSNDISNEPKETSNESLQSTSENNNNVREVQEGGAEELEIIATPFEDTLDQQDGTKYLTYLPYAGITNQFYGMLRGMELAKALGRTLIIPPITASSHDKSKQNQPWSKFLDLVKFSELTGIKVVEFHQLRDFETAELSEIKCGITCGFGSKRTIDFTAKGFLKQWKLNAELEPLRIDATKLDTITSLLRGQSEDKYICISNTYKIAVKDKSEWERFGQHLHFTPELESFVQEFLDANLVKPEPAVDPKTKQEIAPEHQYLAIHVRRGDFAAYCQGNVDASKMIHCLPTTEQIAERIDVIQTKLSPDMNPSKMLPVFVATNERQPEELKKFADLGWQYLDHEQMGTAERLGVFGPMMVDQVFMAHAQGLVGIQMSTFSRVGALRQRDWHRRQVEYM
ncbi:hypothetical protein BGZ58_007736 [Dissophora ornata]|nr:hypothetical protein BGZ58_007736 [Dissophora ornata]